MLKLRCFYASERKVIENKMKYILVILTGVILSATASASEDVSTEIKVLIVNNMKFMQEENATKTMNTIHSKSPMYTSTKNIIEKLFKNYDLSYKLKSYKFIAHDADLAYARVVQSTKKVSGLKFNNNELEAIQVFRKEDGAWKFWTQANVSILFIK